ncbi:unnamed protein product, partial [Polarella glacialis]
ATQKPRRPGFSALAQAQRLQDEVQGAVQGAQRLQDSPWAGVAVQLGDALLQLFLALWALLLLVLISASRSSW